MSFRHSTKYREAVVLGCDGCFYSDPMKLLKGEENCTRKGKREIGKLGKCLNKKKAKKY